MHLLLADGTALPLSIDLDPTSSVPATKLKGSKPVQKCPAWRPQRRTADSCRSGNSYIREQFCPGPTSMSFKLKPSFSHSSSSSSSQQTCLPFLEIKTICPHESNPLQIFFKWWMWSYSRCSKSRTLKIHNKWLILYVLKLNNSLKWNVNSSEMFRSF